jgi:hypothetical protein
MAHLMASIYTRSSVYLLSLCNVRGQRPPASCAIQRCVFLKQEKIAFSVSRALIVCAAQHPSACSHTRWQSSTKDNSAFVQALVARGPRQRALPVLVQ